MVVSHERGFRWIEGGGGGSAGTRAFSAAADDVQVEMGFWWTVRACLSAYRSACLIACLSVCLSVRLSSYSMVCTYRLA